jgi:hypothetical protein
MRGSGVFSLGRHALNEQKIVFQLKIAQVGMDDGREDNFPVSRSIRKAQQELAAIKEKKKADC